MHGSLSVLLKLFQNTEAKGTFPNSFYEISIILTPEPKSLPTPTSLQTITPVSTDARLLSRLPATNSPEHCRLTQQDQMEFFSGGRDVLRYAEPSTKLYYVNRTK